MSNPSRKEAASPRRRECFELEKKAGKRRQKKATEHYKQVKVTGDGRCMFRALALGLAHIQKRNVTKREETEEADVLRNACFERMCRNEEKRREHPEATMAVKYGESGGLERYCRRLQAENFWGGEVELLILVQMIKRPIKVYLPASMAKNASSGSGFVCIQTYGEAFAERTSKHTGAKTKREPVRLLYDGSTHYDLLI